MHVRQGRTTHELESAHAFASVSSHHNESQTVVMHYATNSEQTLMILSIQSSVPLAALGWVRFTPRKTDAMRHVYFNKWGDHACRWQAVVLHGRANLPTLACVYAFYGRHETDKCMYVS